MLELVLRWVQRRRGNSQSEAEAVELLRRVRLELVDPGFLRKARRRNPVRDKREGWTMYHTSLESLSPFTLPCLCKYSRYCCGMMSALG